VLKDAASGSANLMEPIFAVVREYATLGEICNVLRGFLANTGTGVRDDTED
jgi:methylmalonyl-CoA mutase N-terminal domain/subunit